MVARQYLPMVIRSCMGEMYLGWIGRRLRCRRNTPVLVALLRDFQSLPNLTRPRHSNTSDNGRWIGMACNGSRSTCGYYNYSKGWCGNVRILRLVGRNGMVWAGIGRKVRSTCGNNKGQWVGSYWEVGKVVKYTLSPSYAYAHTPTPWKYLRPAVHGY